MKLSEAMGKLSSAQKRKIMVEMYKTLDAKDKKSFKEGIWKEDPKPVKQHTETPAEKKAREKKEEAEYEAELQKRAEHEKKCDDAYMKKHGKEKRKAEKNLRDSKWNDYTPKGTEWTEAPAAPVTESVDDNMGDYFTEGVKKNLSEWMSDDVNYQGFDYDEFDEYDEPVMQRLVKRNNAEVKSMLKGGHYDLTLDDEIRDHNGKLSYKECLPDKAVTALEERNAVIRYFSDRDDLYDMGIPYYDGMGYSLDEIASWIRKHKDIAKEFDETLCKYFCSHAEDGSEMIGLKRLKGAKEMCDKINKYLIPVDSYDEPDPSDSPYITKEARAAAKYSDCRDEWRNRK